MTPEFNLIQQYFTRNSTQAILGVGDDAAILPVTQGMQLVTAVDTMVVNRHFLSDADAYGVGWKSLAVNLSDLAAMGATPRWALLALTLPEINDGWLRGFSEGFYACASNFGVELVGGDTTKGALTISVTVMGEIAPQQALRRDAAKIGDDIWVSGWLGEAALGLRAIQKEITLPAEALKICRAALDRPIPRVELGLRLRNLAHAAIDISDGLLADLGHILERSVVGAEILIDHVPAHPVLQHFLLGDPLGMQCLLTGGDDYELCFTALPENAGQIQMIGELLDLKLSRIGKITASGELLLLDAQNQVINFQHLGYDHFA